MKRLERPPLVIYAERRLALGLVGLYLCGVGVFLFFFVPGITILWLGAVPFGVYGAACLFHRRDFIIDRTHGKLRMLQRGLFRRSTEASYEIQDLEVRVLGVLEDQPGPAVAAKTMYQGWVFEHGEPVQFLTRGRDLGTVQNLASGFARDLGRPCQAVAKEQAG